METLGAPGDERRDVLALDRIGRLRMRSQERRSLDRFAIEPPGKPCIVACCDVLHVVDEQVERRIDQHRLHERTVARDPNDPIMIDVLECGDVPVEHVLGVAAGDDCTVLADVLGQLVVVGVGRGRDDHGVDALGQPDSSNHPVDHREPPQGRQRLAREPRRPHPRLDDHRSVVHGFEGASARSIARSSASTLASCCSSVSDGNIGIDSSCSYAASAWG